MKTRIIFLDDEPRTIQRFRESLEKNDYKICVPKSVEEAIQEINLNGAELLIHSSHSTQTYKKLCEGVFAQYPQFPSIHFLTGDTAQKHHSLPGGTFHHLLRPLLPEKAFLRRVRKLIFLGRLRRENQALKQALHLHKQIDTVLETTDLNSLKARVIDFFNTEFKAQNTFFLNQGAYGYFLHEMWKVAPLSADDFARYPRHSVFAANDCSEDDLSKLLTYSTPFLPQGWELRKNVTFVMAKNGENRSLLFIPLVGPQSKKVLAHVLLVNPLLYGDVALQRAMPYIMNVVGRHFEQVDTFTDAKSLSYIDDLTDLYNQRYLKLVLDKEINRAQRSGSCFSVLFMDIDHFKNVNDTRGHLIGSQVLVELSKILRQNTRTVDYGFRYGGDEFLLILIGTNSEQAVVVAERIRKQVEEASFKVDSEEIRLTVSIGISSYPEHATTKEQIIEMADRAMYCGKNKSRNVVYVAS